MQNLENALGPWTVLLVLVAMLAAAMLVKKVRGR